MLTPKSQRGQKTLAQVFSLKKQAVSVESSKKKKSSWITLEDGSIVAVPVSETTNSDTNASKLATSLADEDEVIIFC